MTKEEIDILQTYLSSKEKENIHIGLTLLDTFPFIENCFNISELVLENFINIHSLFYDKVLEFSIIQKLPMLNYFRLKHNINEEEFRVKKKYFYGKILQLYNDQLDTKQRGQFIYKFFFKDKRITEDDR